MLKTAAERFVLDSGNTALVVPGKGFSLRTGLVANEYDLNLVRKRLCRRCYGRVKLRAMLLGP